MLSVKHLVVDIDGSPLLFRTIMGMRKPVAGAIALEGRELLGLAPFQIARVGIGFAPGERSVRRPDGGREHPAPDLSGGRRGIDRRSKIVGG
jgi:hypothetical protein